jgi:serine-type D-Ala-D-Ala carboxypeptidase (penicillin-binding protein 5/6)
MKGSRYLVTFGILLLGIAIGTPRLDGLEVEVLSGTGCLIDAESGRILWARQEHQECSVASTIKVATALTILEAYGEVFNPDERILASREALRKVPAAQRKVLIPHGLVADGTNIHLQPGEQMTARQLLEGLMICSANDAANVLAEHYGKGSISAFVQVMNDYLQSIGCQHTHLRNPHGLDVPDHYTTAADLGLITWRAMKHPLFREIVAKRNFSRPKTNKAAARIQPGTNRLQRPGPQFDARAIGVKTGSTSKAGSCLIGAAATESREVITVILGAEGTNRYRDTKALFDAAFNEGRVKRVWQRKGAIGTNRLIRGGAVPLQPAIREELCAEIYPSNEGQVRVELCLSEILRPPLRTQDCVGWLRAVDEQGRILAQLPIYPEAEVPLLWSYRVSQLWKHWGRWGDGAALLSLFIALSLWAWALTRPYQAAELKPATVQERSPPDEPPA